MHKTVRYLGEEDTELRGVYSFQHFSDHKNKVYLMMIRNLAEFQMCFSLVPSKLNFAVACTPGKLDERAETLSRTQQVLYINLDHERLTHRTTQLIRPKTSNERITGTI